MQVDKDHLSMVQRMTPKVALAFISSASSWEEFCCRVGSMGQIERVPLGPPISAEELNPQLVDTRYVCYTTVNAEILVVH